jgi:hypothetical protein
MSDSNLEKEKEKLVEAVSKAGHPYMKCLRNPNRLPKRDFCVRILYKAILMGTNSSVRNVGPTCERGLPIWIPRILDDDSYSFYKV